MFFESTNYPSDESSPTGWW